MINVAYITDVHEDVLPGVNIKIEHQIKALSESGIRPSLFRVVDDGCVFNTVKHRIPLCSDGQKWDSIDVAYYECLYIRKPRYISRNFIAFLRQVRRLRGDSITIILELPSFPYDNEFSRCRAMPLLLKDRANRKKLLFYVDRLVDLSGHEEIFGIPTIRMFNGLDLRTVQVRRPSNNSGKHIELICVAAFARWHGVDRVLEGMAEYYSSSAEHLREVNLHLLGDGPELRMLFDLAKRLDVLGHVEFYGQCGREEMDVLYDRCSLAMASLGMHRIGLSVASTLKTREYLAKGMPFVYSGEIDVFLHEPVDFCLQVPADESAVDIQKLVEFHDQLYSREPEERLIARIRDYAERNVSMEKGMANVIDYIKENCGE